jgi:branched-chain amino acid transport system permease protein
MFCHIRSNLVRCLGAAACILALIMLPSFADNYILHIANYSMIFLIPALGLNLIFGYAGLLSFAQGAFFGIGAYVYALLALSYGMSFWLAYLASGFFCAIIALPLGVPALRLRAYSFVMCTLGFVFLAETISKNWVSVTNGEMALAGIPGPRVRFGSMDVVLVTPGDYFFLHLALALLALGLFWLIASSPAGRSLRAIRDEETLASSFGLPAFAYKMCAFSISAFFAGVGGAAYAAYQTVVSPQIFQIYFNLLFMVIVFAGGAGTIGGVILGSVLFVALPEVLRVTPEFRFIVYGIAFVLLALFLPEGLGPGAARLFKRIRT